MTAVSIHSPDVFVPLTYGAERFIESCAPVDALCQMLVVVTRYALWYLHNTLILHDQRFEHPETKGSIECIYR